MKRFGLRVMSVSVLLGSALAAAPAQQQGQGDANRQAPPPPPPPRAPVPIPGDSRVPLPRDSRAPLGSTRLQGLPPASERIRQGPVDPPRNMTPPSRPGSEPQDVRADIARARQLEADARRRYGLDGGTSVGSGGTGAGPWTGRPWPHHRRYRGYYPGYYYNPPYVQVPYDTGVYTDPGTDVGNRRDWAGDGPLAADPDARNGRLPGGPDGGAAQGPPRVPDLPPDELLGDDELPPDLRRALDASPEWKQATADLIQAWAVYAEAVDAVLAGLQDKPEYRRARAELLRTKARLDAAQAAAGAAALRPGPAAGAGAGAGAGADAGAPPDRLVSAADDALKARRAARQLESAALESDPDVQRAERRLDDAVERRNQIRDKIAANLPHAEAPATQKRPKLLEDDE